MNASQTSTLNDSVADEARNWVVRLDELSSADRVQLDRWLEQSDIHRAKFEAAKKEWQSMAFLQQLQSDPAMQAYLQPAKKRAHVRRYALPLAAAAMLTAVALTIWWVFPLDYQADYRTAIGEQLNISLPDESAVILNTNTRLTAHFTGEQRNVRLDYGEAHFEVAHDPARPFVVIAGAGIVRAVGTAFNVYVHEERVEVTVTDGEVEILRRPERSNASVPDEDLTESRGGPVQRLTEGHNASITQTIEAVAAVDPETLERKLAWHHGMLEFVNAPLGEVIAEAGRYTVKTLVITDAELETYPVTIMARASNIDGLLRNLDDSTDAFDVTHVSDTRVLISSAPPR